MDEVVEVNQIELEEDGLTSNDGIVKNNSNNNVQKGIVGNKRHKQLGIERDESDDEDVEIEEVELEFDNAIPKLHNHNAYCPNCNAQITKVILRRRIPKKIVSPTLTTTTERVEEERDPELLGCLSCFSIFMTKGTLLIFFLHLFSSLSYKSFYILHKNFMTKYVI